MHIFHIENQTVKKEKKGRGLLKIELQNCFTRRLRLVYTTDKNESKKINDEIFRFLLAASFLSFFEILVANIFVLLIELCFMRQFIYSVLSCLK